MTAIDPKAYWIWLQHALGAGSSKQNRVLSGYATLADFYRAGREAWLLEGYFSPKELRALGAYTIEEAQALLDYCKKIGQWVLTPDSPDYPEPLRQIHNPPCVLYGKGKLPNFEEVPAVSIVGTRKATATGKTAARSFAFELARKGFAVVSGGALGIDTAAHQGALQAGGLTVCVLGCGIETEYLMVNASMRDAIAAKGALISEYPPQTQPTGSNFPIRNRIISGLSLGTLVVEAAAKSGSLITADFALEQGRDVFAVPAGIFSPVSEGVNNLIKCGAKPVSRADDILEEYFFRFPGKIHLDVEKSDVIIEDNELPAPPANSEACEKEGLEGTFSEDARKLYSCLGPVPRHISELETLTGIPAARLLSAVTELELEEKIVSHSGRRFSLPR